MQIRTIGIIGFGAFGSLLSTLVKRFAPGVEVLVHSARHESDGIRFFDLEDVAACDALVLCVPIRALEETLRRVVPLTRKDTVIVDVATVKVYPVGLLRKLAADRPYIATHPMWGPESYEKKGREVKGFRIVIAESVLPDGAKEELAAFLRSLGFDVVEMDAELHDKHLAETLFLTHFIGQVISRADFARTEIDTVSFGYLMSAVESVKRDVDLFKDVFRFNPYCKEVLDRFQIQEKEVRALLKE